jgi:hypothetical protein
MLNKMGGRNGLGGMRAEFNSGAYEIPDGIRTAPDSLIRHEAAEKTLTRII